MLVLNSVSSCLFQHLAYRKCLINVGFDPKKSQTLTESLQHETLGEAFKLHDFILAKAPRASCSHCTTNDRFRNLGIEEGIKCLLSKVKSGGINSEGDRLLTKGSGVAVPVQTPTLLRSPHIALCECDVMQNCQFDFPREDF